MVCEEREENMKAWFLARIKGAGTVADPYRADLPDVPLNTTALIPSKPDGTPKYTYCLVKVSGKPENVEAVKTHAGIIKELTSLADVKTEGDKLQSGFNPDDMDIPDVV